MKKYIINPIFWIAAGLLVFSGLYIAEVPATSPWALVLFIPCLVMSILTGIGAIKWRR